MSNCGSCPSSEPYCISEYYYSWVCGQCCGGGGGGCPDWYWNVYKVKQPENQQIPPASNQTVTVVDDSGHSQGSYTDNPASYYQYGGYIGTDCTYGVTTSVTVPSGYYTSYTVLNSGGTVVQSGWASSFFSNLGDTHNVVFNFYPNPTNTPTRTPTPTPYPTAPPAPTDTPTPIPTPIGSNCYLCGFYSSSAIACAVCSGGTACSPHQISCISNPDCWWVSCLTPTPTVTNTPTNTPTQTPTPVPGCTCTGWSDMGCNISGCVNSMYQVRSCNLPPGCFTETNCDPRPACVPTSIPTPTNTPTPPPAATNTPTPTATNTPTPTPIVCIQPAPRDPPIVDCMADVSPSLVRWQWPAVTNATQYEIDIYDEETGTYVPGENNGWVSAADFGCAGGGMCEYQTNLGLGSYYSRVRAGGPCPPSSWGQSNTVSVDACPEGQVDVEFYPAVSMTTCITDSSTTLPDAQAAVQTACNHPGDDTGPRSCEATENMSLRDGGTFTNLYVRATPAQQTQYYTDIVSLPSTDGANWIQCEPGSHGSETSTFTYNSLPAAGQHLHPAPNPIDFGVTQNVGNWIQTVGGNVHTQIGNWDWSTPKAWMANPNYFNLAGTLSNIGLITADGTLECSDSTGPDAAGDYDTHCHPPAENDWQSASGYSIASDATANPTSYAHFSALFPDKTSGTTPITPGTISSQYGTDGTYIVTGDLSFTGGGPGGVTVNNKLIIFVTGNVNIDTNIDVAGSGFLAIFADGAINVASTVTQIDGIFLSDNAFSALAGANDTYLTVTGTVIASALTVSRTFENVGLSQSQPTVQIVFNPALIVNMPETLKHDINPDWQEIAK